ncbi:MAG TPA: SurA N-terminal domain-containing protein [Balneolales bacterium]|nr:SurA N-terminal domain-containing protein [Balneolales bacterium]
MEKMRSSTKWIFWVLIISFGLLWGLADTKVFNAIMRGPQNLGTVNGKSISIHEYNTTLNQYIQNYQQQTKKDITPEIRAYFKDMAWNQLVMNTILDGKMKKIGITVPDEEVVSMVTGKHPDPLILQQFQRKDGTLDRVALQAAIKAPENTKAWLAIEKQLRQKRRRQKLNNYVQSAMVISNEAIDQAYIKNNSTASFEYVRYPYSDIPDSTIQVTTSDMRTYYETHKNLFKQKESWRFKYVTFSKAATKKDTLRTIKEMKQLKPQLAKAKNDSAFMAENQSATSYNDSWFTKDEVKKPLQIVFSLKKSEVSNVIQIGGRLHLLKKIAERRRKGKTEIKFVDFSRDVKADPIETIDKVANKAGDFSYYAQQSSFDNEAKTEHLKVHSALATKGNPYIPGIGQSRQILDLLKESKVGKISKAIEMNDQFVVVKIESKTPAGIRPFDQVKGQIRPIVINQKRKKQIEQKIANQLKSNNNLQSLAQATGKKVEKASDVNYSDFSIPNGGREPAVIGAVFHLPLNKISEPIEGESAVFVVNVTSRNMADPSKMTAAQRNKIQNQLQQQIAGAYGQIWMTELKKESDITDNRSILQRQ